MGFDGSATLSHNLVLLDTSLSKRIWSFLLLQFSITIINHIVSIIILAFYHKTKKQNLPDGPSLAEVPKGLQKVIGWKRNECLDLLLLYYECNCIQLLSKCFNILALLSTTSYPASPLAEPPRQPTREWGGTHNVTKKRNLIFRATDSRNAKKVWQWLNSSH